MVTLGLDTSTKVATIAVVDRSGVIGEYSLSKDMSHSEKLMPMIREVLDNIDMKIEDIDLFSVGIGPGSFTGLRIGLSTMKSFSHLLKKPIVGVSTLKALAYNMYGSSSIIMPMLDARRDRVYTGLYKFEDGVIVEVEEPFILPIKDIEEKLEAYERIIINGSLAYKEEIESLLPSKVSFGSLGQNINRATSICEVGIDSFDRGETDDPFTLVPEYIRETKAERDLKA